MKNTNEGNRYIKARERVNSRKKASRHIHFGFVMFFLIFAYLIFMIVLFGVKENVTYTTADPGVLLSSNIFEGLMIKKETVVVSPGTGSLNYLMPEGAKVKLNQAVCVVDKDNAMSSLLEESMKNTTRSIDSDATIGKGNNAYLLATLKNYVMNANDRGFDTVYTAKRNVEQAVVDIQRSALLDENPVVETLVGNLSTYEDALASNLKVVRAPVSGLVSYRFDGMEDITYDSFGVRDLDRKQQFKDGLRQQEINSGDLLYKLTDNYLWHIAAEIDSNGYEYLKSKQDEGMDYVRIQLLDSEKQLDVKIDRVWIENGNFYCVFVVDRLMSEFLQVRFADFKIIYQEYSGIKLPNTSVVDRKFIEIPEEGLVISGKNAGIARLVQSADAVGNMTQVFIRIPYYYVEDGMAYIPVTDEVVPGLEICYLQEGESELTKLVLGSPTTLEGVYEINKGYAAFKIVETVYMQDDYRIVKDDTPYGVRAFDRIATVGASVNEAQILQ